MSYRARYRAKKALVVTKAELSCPISHEKGPNGNNSRVNVPNIVQKRAAR
ncbi:hypothetical protein HHO41_10220 [Bacillus sp. DNRA2]|nr:hypothetical protein [Bacillus sp. DNRA2]NMD70667.1 hypothetical protein [Bacillus sp. DNRA2]